MGETSPMGMPIGSPMGDINNWSRPWACQWACPWACPLAKGSKLPMGLPMGLPIGKGKQIANGQWKKSTMAYGSRCSKVSLASYCTEYCIPSSFVVLFFAFNSGNQSIKQLWNIVKNEHLAVDDAVRTSLKLKETHALVTNSLCNCVKYLSWIINISRWTYGTFVAIIAKKLAWTAKKLTCGSSRQTGKWALPNYRNA